MLLKIDTNIKPIYAHSLDEFNSYVEKYQCANKIKLTKQQNIAQETLRELPASLTWKRGNRMEFHYIDYKKHIRVLYALHFDERSDNKGDQRLAYNALNYFKGILDVIPTDDQEKDSLIFTCPENKASAYYNYINERYLNMTVDHCYSLDRNNSFPASLMKVYPQTRPWIEKYYQERLNYPDKSSKYYQEFKLYGSIIVGWLQRKKRKHAWKKVISNSNMRVHALRHDIEKAGNTVLLVNTDAIKFIGEYPYQESKELGGFKYEWKDTKMFIKGVKSYAYLDGDKWKVKQAGKCKLDSVKDRKEWTLEDFKAQGTESIAVVKIKDNKLVEVYEKI